MRIRLNKRHLLTTLCLALILCATFPIIAYTGDGATKEHRGDSVPVTATPGRTIAQVYETHREQLGRLVGSEVVAIRGYASYQVCAEGIIIAHGLGAFELHGPIYQKFLALHHTRHRPLAFSDDRNNADFLTARIKMIGLPTTDVLPFGIRGSFSLFEHAVIFYLREEAAGFDPAAGAFLVSGAFYDKWNLWAGAFRAPHTEILPTARAGVSYQHFDAGVMYQSTRGVVALFGDMYRYWATATRGLDNDPDFRSAVARDPFLIGWPTTDREGNPVLGFPISDQTTSSDGSVRQEFENGTLVKRPLSLPRARLRFFAQNMALLPSVFVEHYKGTERERALQAIIRHLREEQYDVVGLSECFIDRERDRIWGELRTIYPHRLDGPDEGDIIEQDGGLLLLSRYPITEQHQTIFRQCSGTFADCLANKGALHARIQIPGFPDGMGYDVFLSHMQNPDEGGRETSRATLSRQFSHLSSFVRANTNPDRPAILLGDLNTNALSREINRELRATVYDDMRRKLNFPRDAWLVGGGGGSGITFDSSRSFEASRRALAISAPARHRSGQRIDYFLSWQGDRFLPQFSHSQVVVLQSSVDSEGRGRDISDHYGISTDIISIQEFTVELRTPITRVRVELSGFRCLEVTRGFITTTRRTNDDEPFFELRISPERGALPEPGARRVGRVKGIHNGSSHAYAGVLLEVGDPGSYLDIAVRGWEWDDIGDNDLGSQRIRLTRNDLLRIAGGSMTRVLPMFTGDGSEYAVTVRVTVDR